MLINVWQKTGIDIQKILLMERSFEDKLLLFFTFKRNWSAMFADNGIRNKSISSHIAMSWRSASLLYKLRRIDFVAF